MLRFKMPPDVVFQAILRKSISHAIDIISDLLSVRDDARLRADYLGLFPEISRVYPPSLARTTLKTLRNCHDMPGIYHLGEYHYLLLHDVLKFYSDIHNSLVTKSRSKKKKREASFVDPFYIEQIISDELIALYFFDIDFLLDTESLLSLAEQHGRTLNAETFGLSLGLMPHPEELALNIDTDIDPQAYRISPSNFFGPELERYPDIRYKRIKPPEH